MVGRDERSSCRIGIICVIFQEYVQSRKQELQSVTVGVRPSLPEGAASRASQTGISASHSSHLTFFVDILHSLYQKIINVSNPNISTVFPDSPSQFVSRLSSVRIDAGRSVVDPQEERWIIHEVRSYMDEDNAYCQGVKSGQSRMASRCNSQIRCSNRSGRIHVGSIR